MKKSFIIILVVTIVAVVFYAVRYVNAPVETQVAKIKTIEGKFSMDGMIVYDEKVYTAQNDGTFYSYTSEGERVAKDKCLATVYNGVVDKEILQSLNNLDKKIEVLERNSGLDKIYKSDELSVQSTIESLRTDIVKAVVEEDYQKIYDYKKRLEAAVGVGEDSDTAGSLAELKKEKKEIEAEISKTNKDIYSDVSGIYTTLLDGLENVITPTNLAEFNVEKFRELQAPEEGVMGNRAVEKDDLVCKVVDNHEWYAVGVITKEERENITVGDKVKLRVEKLPGIDVDASIEFISEEAEDAEEFLVTVKCEQYLEGVFNIRKSKTDIILNSFYGYEVPVYAICVKNGKTGVMVMGNETEIFKECKVLYRNNKKETVIIGPSDTGNRLIDGDQIILGEK